MARPSNIQRSLLGVLLVAATATTAFACLWDYDTLQMERRRFPGVLELITGKFVRHSKAYYEWRLKDRTKKLEARPDDPALIDDLAVAHDKLGQQEKGIALLEESLKRHPDRYETLANLGTLLFHAGRIEESKAYIERAIGVNPDAHFGRERYQLLLTEYLLQSDRETNGVMCIDERSTRSEKVLGFARFVLIAKFGEDERYNYTSGAAEALAAAPKQELQNAGKGVLGMMHFANYQSPVLLEALGDLLMTGAIEENATQLAARAYLRAAAGSTDPAVVEKYRTMARDVLNNHEAIAAHHREDGDYLVKVEQQLAREMAAAKNWFSDIEKNEQRWISEGRDVDQEFAAVYYSSLAETIEDAAEQVASEKTDSRRPPGDRAIVGALALFCVMPTLLMLVLAVASILWIRQRRAIPVVPEPIPKAF